MGKYDWQAAGKKAAQAATQRMMKTSKSLGHDVGVYVVAFQYVQNSGSGQTEIYAEVRGDKKAAIVGSIAAENVVNNWVPNLPAAQQSPRNQELVSVTCEVVIFEQAGFIFAVLVDHSRNGDEDTIITQQQVDIVQHGVDVIKSSLK